MAMNRFFWCFCINRVGMRPLQYHSSRSDFGFEFVFEKWLSAINDMWSRQFRVSVIRGVPDSLYQWYAESHCWYGESAIEFFKRKLFVSVIRRLVNSPNQWYGESPTPRILGLGSLRLRVSLIRRVDDSAYHWVGKWMISSRMWMRSSWVWMRCSRVVDEI